MKLVFKNKAHATAFKKAAKWVKNKTGTVDGFLESGGLDCSACGKMLERATGKSMYSYDGWDAQETHKRANWDFPFDEEDAWAYWSAKLFLEVCAKLKLWINFSW